VDPYGSAAPFIDSAVQAVSDGGLLCITCTDMSVLCGNYPEVCYAKYSSMPLRSKFLHEMSLRALLHSIDATANKYKRYIVPWLSLSVDFYVRVFVRVFESAKEVKNSSLKRVMVYQSTQCPLFIVQKIGYGKEAKNYSSNNNKNNDKNNHNNNKNNDKLENNNNNKLDNNDNDNSNNNETPQTEIDNKNNSNNKLEKNDDKNQIDYVKEIDNKNNKNKLVKNDDKNQIDYVKEIDNKNNKNKLVKNDDKNQIDYVSYSAAHLDVPSTCPETNGFYLFFFNKICYILTNCCYFKFFLTVDNNNNNYCYYDYIFEICL
jgi:hypothetical protein